MEHLSKKEYAKMCKAVEPHGKNFLNYLYAFLIGGFICAMAEALREWLVFMKAEETVINSLVPIVFIFLSAILTYFKVFKKIAKVAGAGTLIPITGFANAVVSPAMEYKTEGYILGTAVKMFIIAGPVIAFGTLFGVLYGICYYIFGVI